MLAFDLFEILVYSVVAMLPWKPYYYANKSICVLLLVVLCLINLVVFVAFVFYFSARCRRNFVRETVLLREQVDPGSFVNLRVRFTLYDVVTETRVL